MGETILECLKCGYMNFKELTTDAVCGECGDNLFIQREAEIKKTVIAEASKIEDRHLLSNNELARVESIVKAKWHTTQNLAHVVEIKYKTDKGYCEEIMTVEPWNAGKRVDAYRFGQIAKLKKKLKSFGFRGEDLNSMRHSNGQWDYMPLYVVIGSDKRVLCSTGSQPSKAENDTDESTEPCIADQLALFFDDDSRGQGTR